MSHHFACPLNGLSRGLRLLGSTILELTRRWGLSTQSSAKTFPGVLPWGNPESWVQRPVRDHCLSLLRTLENWHWNQYYPLFYSFSSKALWSPSTALTTFTSRESWESRGYMISQVTWLKKKKAEVEPGSQIFWFSILCASHPPGSGGACQSHPEEHHGLHRSHPRLALGICCSGHKVTDKVLTSVQCSLSLERTWISE